MEPRLTVWPQAKQQGGNTVTPINRKLDSRFTEQDPTHPSFPHSQSLTTGRFNQPLIHIYYRAGIVKTTVTEN